MLSILTVIMQLDAATPNAALLDLNANRCGPRALAVCFNALDRTVTDDEIIELLPRTGIESSLAELKTAAERLGFSTCAIRWTKSPPAFRVGTTAAIIPIRTRTKSLHFVAMLACDANSVTLIDDPYGPTRLSIRHLREKLAWDGTALHLGPDPKSLEHIVQPGFWWLQPGLIAAFIVCLGGFVATIWRGRIAKETRAIAPQLPICDSMQGSPRSGLTIVELLVVLAIVGLLLSVSAPAILSVRESSRRMTCSNHLRQLALAAQVYETSFLVFPPSTVPYSSVNAPAAIQTISTHARLLPYLDQQSIYTQIATEETGTGSLFEPVSSKFNNQLLSQRVSIFECPSDAVLPGAVSYRLCMGAAPGWPNGMLRRLTRGRADQEMTDGKSQTVLFSERVVGDRDSARYTPWRDTAFVRAIYISDSDTMAAICRAKVTPTSPHWSWGGGSWLFSGFGHTWYNHVSPPNSPLPDCVGNAIGASIFGWGDIGAHTARSFHVGGVNAAFADGASRTINNNIDLKVWRALGTDAGGEVVSDQ